MNTYVDVSNGMKNPISYIKKNHQRFIEESYVTALKYELMSLVKYLQDKTAPLCPEGQHLQRLLDRYGLEEVKQGYFNKDHLMIVNGNPYTIPEAGFYAYTHTSITKIK